MRDFTLKTYKKLIVALKENGYNFITFSEYEANDNNKIVILRHDSDTWIDNDLNLAIIESGFKVRSTYFFRIPKTFDRKIIKEIRDLGHEIGYHYEDLVFTRGNKERAYKRFRKNLSSLRSIYPISSIAMHGSPLSKWDSKLIWEKYSYNELDVNVETNLSFDFDKILYLTDTGSKWNGDKEIVRDRVTSHFDYNIETTFDLMKMINESNLPDQIIINTHAARWNDNLLLWGYRFVLQKMKNTLKKVLNKLRGQY